MEKQTMNNQDMMRQQKFEAISRMCLNNWHYIKHKVLEFNQDINFFTGHSGSGKSTVIDALQVLLYANTDGRSFFNKAASDDSDRSLIEYLRGMTNIEDNNKFSYLRNKNFSSTIVLELNQTESLEKQCIGVAFDVETGTNEVSRQFFWHRGGLLDNLYRVDGRTMTIDEIKAYCHANMGKEDYFYSSTNERFRKKMYDEYLGGLDAEKFPTLFKRAISFRMDIKIEEFVKEFICMEQDIHIEDMQVSVTEYGRMRKKIQDTFEEIQELEKIHGRHQEYESLQSQQHKYGYFAEKMNLLKLKRTVEELNHKLQRAAKDLELQNKSKTDNEKQLVELEKKSEELVKQIAATGLDECKSQLGSVNALLERLLKSKVRWDETAQHLNVWADQEITPNQVIWDVDKFMDYSIKEEELDRLKSGIEEIRKEIARELTDINGKLRDYMKQEKELKDELVPLKSGKKSYPKELEAAREQIKNELCSQFNRPVDVEILANLLDIKDEEWRNAVEGYLGNNKLALIVEPKYAKAALKIYQKMDKKKYHRVAVLDTEKIEEQEFTVKEHALAEEIMVKESYIQKYMNFMLGNVIKCHTIEELRGKSIGITSDCMLYKGFRLQHLNPDNYTRYAYIGEASLRKRMHQLEKNIREIKQAMEPLNEQKQERDVLMNLESLSMAKEEYMQWQKDMKEARKQQREKEKLEQRLKEIESQNVVAWEEEHKKTEAEIRRKRDDIKHQEQQIWATNNHMQMDQSESLKVQELLLEAEGNFEEELELEHELNALLLEQQHPRYDLLQTKYEQQQLDMQEKMEGEEVRIREEKAEYLRRYPNRPYSTEEREHHRYEELLDKLQCDDLEKFKRDAADQAKTAVEHFKDDFMYKIRSAIREAMDRQNDLNHVISQLDFGKDKYCFVISKNKGADGKYYDMFMDDSLEVNPSELSRSLEHQMDFFTMNHENDYGDMINDLISIFIPPENATPEELEEAKKNMDKYSDYRTYLSFEMQQIIKGDETIHINLSKMIKKNSGGEGQNPQYVALLASFAQMYRINLASKVRRRPTIRLVVLDEAFSKMDAEKVAGCIKLIRGLGFQAIICATNDKIQNYLENVDKTFVFANPDKKCISIQEFERRDFHMLSEDVVEEA